MLTKDQARKLRGDYIPTGKPVDIRTLRFRKTKDHEILLCCRPTSNDIQSGPIYCGDVSEFVAENDEGYVALCMRHKPPANLILPPAQ